MIIFERLVRAHVHQKKSLFLKMCLDTTKFVLLNVFSVWNNYKNTLGTLFILISFVAFFWTLLIAIFPFLVFGLYSTRLLHLLKPDYLNKIDLLL